MDYVTTFLSQQPLLTLFLTVALGYLVGEIDIKGFSLGSGAVLFVGLLIGWLAPGAAPAPLVGTLGLALFLYTIGIQYGKEFFTGFTLPYGRKANMLSLFSLMIAGGLSLAFIDLFGLKPGYALGLFAGAGTSTPALQSALASVGNSDPAVGYSATYPVGVAVPILLMYLTFIIVKPALGRPADARLEWREIAIRNREFFGKRLAEVLLTLPPGTRLLALREEHVNKFPHPDLLVDEDDVLFVTAASRELLDQAEQLLGEHAPGRMVRDRTGMDYIRVFVSKRGLVGRALGELNIPGGFDYQFVQVTRGDGDLIPNSDLILEYGDRVGLFVKRDNMQKIHDFFGDSIKGTADFSFISVGLGMALGLFIGQIPIPLPGVGTLKLGFAGLLVTSLLLGYFRRTGRLIWTMPVSANLVLRNLGVTIFMAQVGLSSGEKFAAAVAESGMLFILLGTVLVLALVLPVIVIGLFILKMPFADVCGIVSGVTGQPAIPAFASKITGSDRPDIGYAMLYPGTIVLKILFVQLAPAIWGR